MSPATRRSIDALSNELNGSLDDRAIVSIDGVPNAGKSTLGRALADRIGAKFLDLDAFLIPDQKCFVDAIDLPKLAAAMTAVPGRMIVAGVCVLDVLERLEKKPNSRVYVKRMAVWGWADKSEVEGNLLEEIATALGVPVTEYALALEVRGYHHTRRPQDTAEYVFEREEADT